MNKTEMQAYRLLKNCDRGGVSMRVFEWALLMERIDLSGLFGANEGVTQVHISWSLAQVIVDAVERKLSSEVSGKIKGK